MPFNYPWAVLPLQVGRIIEILLPANAHVDMLGIGPEMQVNCEVTSQNLDGFRFGHGDTVSLLQAPPVLHHPGEVLHGEGGHVLRGESPGPTNRDLQAQRAQAHGTWSGTSTYPRVKKSFLVPVILPAAPADLCAAHAAGLRSVPHMMEDTFMLKNAIYKKKIGRHY